MSMWSKDRLYPFPKNDVPAWIECELCEEDWLEGEYDKCPGCEPTYPISNVTVI